MRISTISICLSVLWLIAATRPATAADAAQIQQAIGKGGAYLAAEIENETDSGCQSLAGIAMIKAGIPMSNPALQKLLQTVAGRVQNGAYQPTGRHIYQAGVEVNLLVEADPQLYAPQILAMTQYLLDQQLPNGGWDYPTGREGLGDTSVTQYAMLGLWASARAGVEIPQRVWDNAINWHLDRQNTDGGFSYIPGTTEGHEQGASSMNMTIGAVGSLLIGGRHSFPGKADSLAQLLDIKPEKQQNSNDKFGVLEAVDLTAAPQMDAAAQDPTATTVDLGRLKQGVQRAFEWVAARLRTTKGDDYYATYFYYSLERMGALADVEQIGRIRWYNDCADYLISQQKPEGLWPMSQFPYRDTCFNVLFLARSTGKVLKKTIPVDPIGGGLLAGGRGGLDDLSQVVASGGEIKQKKDLGPLDQLLAALENPSDLDLEQVQEQIVEKVQVGDRNTLIGQKDLLVRYAKHPNAEIRRTAIWALGRTDDLSLARLLIDALDDVDVGVMIEARNALCWLARKPNGLGEAPDPTANLPADATDEQRKAAIATWHAELVKKWGTWYLDNRPYADRGDEFEAALLQKIAAAG